MKAKQRVFVEEYMKCWNATEAARQAGYKHPNQQGPRLLVDVGIRAAIEKRLAEKAMGADEVLARLAEQARGEQSKYITPQGGVDFPALVSDGKAHLVKGIKETKYGLDIEFYDAQAALVHIGRHLKLFTDLSEVSGEITVKVVKGVSMDDL